MGSKSNSSQQASLAIPPHNSNKPSRGQPIAVIAAQPASAPNVKNVARYHTMNGQGCVTPAPKSNFAGKQPLAIAQGGAQPPHVP